MPVRKAMRFTLGPEGTTSEAIDISIEDAIEHHNKMFGIYSEEYHTSMAIPELYTMIYLFMEKIKLQHCE